MTKYIEEVKKDEEGKGFDNRILIGIGVVIIVVIVLFLTQTGTPPRITENMTDDDPFLGPENAKVVMVEFSDFQCPACKAAEPTIKQVLQSYGDKVRFVYRDFPLDTGCNQYIGQAIHPMACEAAIAANCANEQNKFWEFHDKLYENQNVWPSVGEAEFKAYADELGMDKAKFEACLNAAAQDEIKKDVADGVKFGIDSTPTFFINGRKIVGSKPFDAFKSIIDQELAS